MAVWQGDETQQVNQAIESILAQTKQPDEIIIVKDGPVKDDVNACLHKHQNNPIIKIVELPENQGRGPARNHAINNSTSDIIFLMDADDISRPNRLAIQLDMFLSHKLDLLGGFIEEFDNSPGDLGAIRHVPQDQKGIEQVVRFRSAFNHVTIMFWREFFNKIGGYSDLNYVEDWDFYLRAIHAGAKVGNTPEILVDVRKAVWRRRSFEYLSEEIYIARTAFQRRQISASVFVLSLMFRLGKFITPSALLDLVYQKILRQKTRISR